MYTCYNDLNMVTSKTIQYLNFKHENNYKITKYKIFKFSKIITQRLHSFVQDNLYGKVKYAQCLKIYVLTYYKLK